VFGSACIFGTATVSGHCAKFLMFDRCCVCVLIYWMAILSYNELHLEKHESSVNAVEDENSDSLITESISDFMLPAWFRGDWHLIHILHSSPAKCFIVNHHALKISVWKLFLYISFEWVVFFCHTFVNSLGWEFCISFSSNVIIAINAGIMV